MIPTEVRCSPLGRRERIVPVVDTRVRADGQVIYSVDVDGHRFSVAAEDTQPA